MCYDLVIYYKKYDLFIYYIYDLFIYYKKMLNV